MRNHCPAGSSGSPCPVRQATQPESQSQGRVSEVGARVTVGVFTRVSYLSMSPMSSRSLARWASATASLKLRFQLDHSMGADQYQVAASDFVRERLCAGADRPTKLTSHKMSISFTAHNIRLDDGTFTKPDEASIDQQPWFVSARRILQTIYPTDREKIRIADLGCLEGGYSVEFARMGFDVVGIEIRDNNFAACNFVKSKTKLPNLKFEQNDAWNLPSYGKFDVVFCAGLLYHMDTPKQFLEMISSVTSRMIILQTHFATTDDKINKFDLSPLCEHEGLRGRWYTEFADDAVFNAREEARWASWDNRRSFWIQREFLLQAIRNVDFDVVLEQFDWLGEETARNMLDGYYHTDTRGTFIGIKAGATT